MDSKGVTKGPFGDSSDGSAYASCYRWNFKREESLNEDYGSNSSSSENVQKSKPSTYQELEALRHNIDNSDSSGYLEVRHTRNVQESKPSTHLEFQAIRHNIDNQCDSSGYLEVRSIRNVDDGYLTPLPNENEITVLFNPNGDLLDLHGYLRIFDEKPNNSIQGQPYRVSLPTKKVVVCFPKETFESLKTSNVQMKICIVVLVCLFLVALCAFMLTWFGILNRNDCQDSPPDPAIHSAFVCPLKYTFSLGTNAYINCVLPKFAKYTNLVVDLQKTKVRNQDQRLLQVDDIYAHNSISTESERISTRFTASKEYISIMIDINGTHCDDHGYIAINMSGGLFVSIELEVTGNNTYNIAPPTSCPQTARFQWNKTELISCSACIGNTTWNVTWYRGGKSSYIPDLENSVSFINESCKRIVSKVEFALGFIHFKLLNRRVFCSDGGMYSTSLYIDHVEYNFTIKVDVNELAFLKKPKIVQEDHGGFAEGFDLPLKCTVESIGCKKYDIYLSLPNRNTTAECRNINLGTDNINESYACSLAWTELNISRDFNGTSFYCGYNYTHFNGTLLTFQEEKHVFVIPGNFCKDHAAGCKRPHPLGGRFFIECDDRVGYNRPWEVLCKESLVFKHGQSDCEGQCDYPSSQIRDFPSN